MLSLATCLCLLFFLDCGIDGLHVLKCEAFYQKCLLNYHKIYFSPVYLVNTKFDCYL